MPEEVQAKMENSFGEDFSNVAIHDNSTKADDMGAKAFAQGKDVHFAPGEFQPNSKEGQELIGHELTHVVQQKEGKVHGGEVHGKDMVNQNPALEKEADDAGKLASEGKEVKVSGMGSGVQMKEKEVLSGGQMTKEAENANLSASKIHYPGGEYSGVTLGFGFDLGSKSSEKAKASMTEAGIGATQISQLLKAVGKKGSDAKEFVEDYADSIGPISSTALVKLFEISRREHFEDMRTTAISTKAAINGDNYVNARAREVKDNVPAGTYVMSAAEFDNLHPAVLEFMLDLSYMGGFYKFQRVASINKLLKANLNNPLAQLKALRTYMESEEMSKYNDSFGGNKYPKVGHENFFGEDVTVQIGERRRQVIRMFYLNKVIGILESGKEVEISGIDSIKEKAGVRPSPAAAEVTSTEKSSPVIKAPQVDVTKSVNFDGTPIYVTIPSTVSKPEFAVGAASNNYAGDLINILAEVKLVQQKLNELGLLSDADFTIESSLEGKVLFTPSNQDSTQTTLPLLDVEKKFMLLYKKIPLGPQVLCSEIPHTIAAIRLYQKEVMLNPDQVGRINPGGATWTSMSVATKESVAAAREKYKLIKKKEAEDKKRRQEEEKKEAEEKAKSQAFEKKILDSIKSYPLDDTSIELKYDEFMEDGRVSDIKLFSLHHPTLIKKMLEFAGLSSDTLAEKIVSNLYLDELRKLDKSLLNLLRDSLEGGFETDKEEKQRVRIDKVLAEEKEVENTDSFNLNKISKIKSKGENSTKSDAFKKQSLIPISKICNSVDKAGANKVSDVKIIQLYLASFGYLIDLAEIDFISSKKNEESVKDTEIPNTILAIQEYSINALGGSANNKIEPGKIIETSIHNRIKQINSYSNYVVSTKEIPNVLNESQWVTQFRKKNNFKLSDKVLEENFIKEKIEDVGVDGKKVKFINGNESIVVYTSRGIREVIKNQDFPSVPEANSIKENEKEYTGKGNFVCCFDASKQMMKKGGGIMFNSHADAIPTMSQAEYVLNKKKNNKVLGAQAILGVKYIDDLLSKGKPVMVGIDKIKYEKYNADKTTEHWIVIVGKKVVGNKVFYTYFDPGAVTKEGGIGESNLLFLGEDNSLTKIIDDNSFHTVSNIRSK
ncbi:MAG: DUF4157 domain-containing protein [Flavobacterium sp.]|nr:DUF4157 domain-containing protein [Flavobacterium sp.]